MTPDVEAPPRDVSAETAESPPAFPLRSMRRRVAGIVVVVVLLALAALVVLTRTPLFDARTVRVHGATHLRRDAVLRIAGIDGGTNVVTFDTAAAERRLEDDPWVAAATIAKRLPSTLVVTIRERIPVAVAEIGGSLRLVADDGTPLDTTHGAALLPTIAPADPNGAAPSGEAIRGAARAIAAMPAALRRSVAQVSVLADGELRVDLSSGGEVTYGPAENLTAKGRALAALLAWATEQGSAIRSADVEVPTAPTARLRTGAAPSP